MSHSHRPSVHRNPSSGTVPTVRRSRDDDEDIGGRRVRPHPDSSGSSTGDSFPWACPYAKHDPIKFSHSHRTDPNSPWRNCTHNYNSSISRLKQHLYRRHLDTDGGSSSPERMSLQQKTQIENRSQGNPSDTWYKIYEILFPNDPKPASPYAEWVTGQEMRDCLAYLAKRLPRLIVNETVNHGPEEAKRNIIEAAGRPGGFQANDLFQTCAGFIHNAIRQVESEVGEQVGLSHIIAGRRSPGAGGAVPAPPPIKRSPNNSPRGQLKREDEEDDEEEEEDDDEAPSIREPRQRGPVRHAQTTQVAHRGRGGQTAPTATMQTPNVSYVNYGQPQFSDPRVTGQRGPAPGNGSQQYYSHQGHPPPNSRR